MTELKNANVSNVPEAVEVEDMAYQTNAVKIKAGYTIIWTNNDNLRNIIHTSLVLFSISIPKKNILNDRYLYY